MASWSCLCFRFAHLHFAKSFKELLKFNSLEFFSELSESLNFSHFVLFREKRKQRNYGMVFLVFKNDTLFAHPQSKQNILIFTSRF